jgi:hypothetical protein
VWRIIRDFAGMGGWHDAITQMRMLKGVRSDKVSGIRDFRFGDDHLHENLLHLDDSERSFSYYITKSGLPWMNYVSGPRLWPVTDGNQTFGVWTGDWVADPRDDVTLIPQTEREVYLKAFDTIAQRYFGGGR